MAFPNFKGKHAKDSMFSPADFLKYSKKIGEIPSIRVPKSIIICYSKSLIEFIVKNHKTKKIDCFGGKLYLLKEAKNKVGVIGKFGIGAPVAGTVLEELIAWGVKNFISIGTVGTLQKNLKIGDIVVCDKAIRDEGVSHHYIRPSKYSYASKEITEKIKNSLDRLRKKYVAGTSWTIDAPYRETIEEARRYQKQGIVTVEMEAAALFAIAKYRKAKIGAVFVISDSLAELEWKPSFHLKKTKKGLETLYKVSLDVLKNIK